MHADLSLSVSLTLTVPLLDYTDRQYTINNLPNFLKGLWAVKTPNDDKASPDTDLEWLCFDIGTRATVYVLYDRRAHDKPTWLKDDFEDQHIATIDGHAGLYNGVLGENMGASASVFSDSRSPLLTVQKPRLL